MVDVENVFGVKKDNGVLNKQRRQTMARPRKSSSSIFGFQFPEPDVSNFSDKGILLEIGTFLGRSAVDRKNVV